MAFLSLEILSQKSRDNGQLTFVDNCGNGSQSSALMYVMKPSPYVSFII